MKVLLAGVYDRSKRKIFKLIKYIPSVRDKIDKELDGIHKSFENEILHRLKNVGFVTQLPERGLTHEQVLDKVKECIDLGNRVVKQ